MNLNVFFSHAAETSPGGRPRDVYPGTPAADRLGVSALQTVGWSGGRTRMARAEIERVWPDGECLRVSIMVRESYPDSVAEAQAQAAHLYVSALDATVAGADEEDREA